ncbi:MAG: hypothetical protein FWH47_06280 [Methanomassiliicoccaceae archaeon]|nr:hypothetical protein [Methanomassiliicoccaceae archaeon]
MEFKKKVKLDRSGLSSILIAVIVIVVIVVAAGAAYVLLSNNGDEEVKEKEYIAPGTVLEYDMSALGVKAGTAKFEYIGQGVDDYFLKVTYMLTDGTGFFVYAVDPKEVPDGAKKTGTTQLDTIFGKKTVDVWEFTEGGATTISYVDQSNLVLVYKQEGELEGIPVTFDLTKYDPKWQTSYEASASIGITHEYAATGSDGANYTCKIICFADCTGGKYGVVYDIGGAKSYFLSDSPRGLPTDADNEGTTSTIGNAVYGNVSVQLWVYEAMDTDIEFYCDSPTHTIYRFVVPEEDGTSLVFNLTKKP